MVLDNVASGSGPEHDLNLSAAKAREAAAAAAAAAARRALRCDQKPSSQYEYLRELADVVECICEMNLHEDTVRLEGCPGVLEYLVRFTEESGCSPAVFLLMFVYLRRVTRDEFELNYRTAHYLVLACFVIAAKMHDDHSRSNKVRSCCKYTILRAGTHTHTYTHSTTRRSEASPSRS